MAYSFTIHHTVEENPDTSLPDPHQDTFSRTVLGFWIYLLTDLLLFTTLFLTYSLLHNSTFGGPSSKDLFDLSIAFTETMILLCSSVTCGMAVLSAVRDDVQGAIRRLAVTFFLGVSFVAIELQEFYHLYAAGHSWEKSAFLSAFFTLVGTHGAHVSVGLLWIAVMIGQLYKMGVNVHTFRRLVLFSLFWHFLDLVWIFIFTFVYLLGVI